MPTTAVAASMPASSSVTFTSPSETQILLTVSAAIVSGLLAWGLSTWHMRRFEARKVKFDTLKKFVANRFDLKGDEFTRAINEVFVVFNKSESVMAALSAFHAKSVADAPREDELVALFKSMCNDLGVSFLGFNDSFFLKPFNVRASSASAP